MERQLDSSNVELDFIVCNLSMVCAVELDDLSHTSRARQRDAIINHEFIAHLFFWHRRYRLHPFA